MALQLKRGRAAVLYEKNILLAAGEPCQELDEGGHSTGKMKIGDGIHRWNDLPYVDSSISDVISRNTYGELPEEGNENIIYKVNDSKMLYQWNATEKSFEPLTGGGTFDPNSIKLINGGNANG